MCPMCVDYFVDEFAMSSSSLPPCVWRAFAFGPTMSKLRSLFSKCRACFGPLQGLISKRADLFRSKSELRAANSRLVKGLQVMEKRLNPHNTKVRQRGREGGREGGRKGGRKGGRALLQNPTALLPCYGYF